MECRPDSNKLLSFLSVLREMRAFPTLFLTGLGFQCQIAVGIAFKKGISDRNPLPRQYDPDLALLFSVFGGRWGGGSSKITRVPLPFDRPHQW